MSPSQLSQIIYIYTVFNSFLQQLKSSILQIYLFGQGSEAKWEDNETQVCDRERVLRALDWMLAGVFYEAPITLLSSMRGTYCIFLLYLYILCVEYLYMMVHWFMYEG